MARAKKSIVRRGKIHRATRVRADDVQRLDFAIACPPQVNSADGHIAVFVPGVHLVRQNRKFSRNAIVWQGGQGGYFDRSARRRFAAQRIQQHQQTRKGRDEGRNAADKDGQRFFKKIAAATSRAGLRLQRGNRLVRRSCFLGAQKQNR